MTWRPRTTRRALPCPRCSEEWWTFAVDFVAERDITDGVAQLWEIAIEFSKLLHFTRWFGVPTRGLKGQSEANKPASRRRWRWKQSALSAIGSRTWRWSSLWIRKCSRGITPWLLLPTAEPMRASPNKWWAPFKSQVVPPAVDPPGQRKVVYVSDS